MNKILTIQNILSFYCSIPKNAPWVKNCLYFAINPKTTPVSRMKNIALVTAASASHTTGLVAKLFCCTIFQYKETQTRQDMVKKIYETFRFTIQTPRRLACPETQKACYIFTEVPLYADRVATLSSGSSWKAFFCIHTLLLLSNIQAIKFAKRFLLLSDYHAVAFVTKIAFLSDDDTVAFVTRLELLSDCQAVAFMKKITTLPEYTELAFAQTFGSLADNAAIAFAKKFNLLSNNESAILAQIIACFFRDEAVTFVTKLNLLSEAEAIAFIQTFLLLVDNKCIRYAEKFRCLSNDEAVAFAQLVALSFQ